MNPIQFLIDGVTAKLKPEVQPYKTATAFDVRGVYGLRDHLRAKAHALLATDAAPEPVMKYAVMMAEVAAARVYHDAMVDVLNTVDLGEAAADGVLFVTKEQLARCREILEQGAPAIDITKIGKEESRSAELNRRPT